VSEPKNVTTLRERIAFAMWNSSNPEHMRDAIRLGNLDTIVTPLWDGWTANLDLDMDWRLNKPSYLKLADIALQEAAQWKKEQA
jgi:hypothetical protein